MPVNFQKGNLFDFIKTDHKIIIAHGVNCKGKFDKGFVVELAKRFSVAKEMYLKKYNEVGWKLGDVQFVEIGSVIIANCATQDDYKGYNVVNVNYDALEKCMKTVNEIVMPKIGAGLAGGNWAVILEILKRVFEKNYKISVFFL